MTDAWPKKRRQAHEEAKRVLLAYRAARESFDRVVAENGALIVALAGNDTLITAVERTTEIDGLLVTVRITSRHMP